jgi:hypothetical protein
VIHLLGEVSILKKKLFLSSSPPRWVHQSLDLNKFPPFLATVIQSNNI